MQRYARSAMRAPVVMAPAAARKRPRDDSAGEGHGAHRASPAVFMYAPAAKRPRRGGVVSTRARARPAGHTAAPGRQSKLSPAMIKYLTRCRPVDREKELVDGNVEALQLTFAQRNEMPLCGRASTDRTRPVFVTQAYVRISFLLHSSERMRQDLRMLHKMHTKIEAACVKLVVQQWKAHRVVNAIELIEAITRIFNRRLRLGMNHEQFKRTRGMLVSECIRVWNAICRHADAKAVVHNLMFKDFVLVFLFIWRMGVRCRGFAHICQH